MMEGITVLSQSIDYTSRILNGIFAVLFGIIFVTLMVLLILAIKDSEFNLAFYIGVAVTVTGVITGCLIACSVTEHCKTQYKVTISEEVKLKEFNEKYEIIDQDGEIYTIVERDK